MPSLDVLVGPFLAVPKQPALELPGTFPSGVPSGTQFWLPAWFRTGFSQRACAATNAVRATTP